MLSQSRGGLKGEEVAAKDGEEEISAQAPFQPLERTKIGQSTLFVSAFFSWHSCLPVAVPELLTPGPQGLMNNVLTFLCSPRYTTLLRDKEFVDKKRCTIPRLDSQKPNTQEGLSSNGFIPVRLFGSFRGTWAHQSRSCFCHREDKA